MQQFAEGNLEVSSFAKALLEAGYDQEWVHIVEEIQMLPMSGKAEQSPLLQLDTTRLYDAVPNPTNESTTLAVYVDADDAAQHPILVLRDMSGVEIKR